jgi:chromosomal replication initiator protein
MFEKVLEYASKKYMVSTEDILGNKRTANIVAARHFAVYMVRKTTTYSQKQIAELFKRKDHTTIINSINVMEQKVVSDPIFAREMAHTIEEILQG